MKRLPMELGTLSKVLGETAAMAPAARLQSWQSAPSSDFIRSHPLPKELSFITLQLITLICCWFLFYSSVVVHISILVQALLIKSDKITDVCTSPAC